VETERRILAHESPGPLWTIPIPDSDYVWTFAIDGTMYVGYGELEGPMWVAALIE